MHLVVNIQLVAVALSKRRIEGGFNYRREAAGLLPALLCRKCDTPWTGIRKFTLIQYIRKFCGTKPP